MDKDKTKNADDKEKVEAKAEPAPSKAAPAAKAPVKKAAAKPAAKATVKKAAAEDEAASKLVISSSPHFATTENIPRIMYTVVTALIPAMAVSVYLFGPRALLLMLVCVVVCLGSEYAMQKARKKSVRVHDGSAAITGILLALMLPPGFPIYGAVLGSLFSIVIGKMLFGGLGYNIFNPALIGRAFLQATYPVLITTWVDPGAVINAVDAISAATPLAMMKFGGEHTGLGALFFGNTAGSLGETSAIAILIGGLYLRYKGYINWKLPLGYLGSIAFFAAIFWIYDSSTYASPLFHVMAGGAMLGAWFMVTDMVTTPVTPYGQWIFAIGAGFLTIIIRLFGGLPEGVMYSILFMNAFVPLINRHTKPKVFGELKTKKA
ncbi:MAG: RnfABCDGE type electron transport complex subunit D [Thermodesulfobacteriota bacterium]